MKQKFEGVFSALITPFKNGDVDFRSLKKLIRFQLDNKIHGFVVNGTTAESPSLTHSEQEKILEFVTTEVANQVPIIFGTGTNCTATALENTLSAKQKNVAAALVVVPYYNKPPQRGLEKHFSSIAKAVSPLPILLYNVPGRTVASLEIETIEQLSKIENIVGIKEATGNLILGRQITQKCRNDFLLLSGDDATYLQLILQSGGVGLIGVASQIMPRQFVDWFNRAMKNDLNVVSEFVKYKKLIEAIYLEANPIPVKMALFMMGIIESPELRLPLMELDSRHRDYLKNLLTDHGCMV